MPTAIGRNGSPECLNALVFNPMAYSDLTIAVLSEHYLKAECSQPEWAAAFARDPTGKNRKHNCSPEIQASRLPARDRRWVRSSARSVAAPEGRSPVRISDHEIKVKLVHENSPVVHDLSPVRHHGAHGTFLLQKNAPFFLTFFRSPFHGCLQDLYFFAR
jgi:hypothetical protein